MLGVLLACTLAVLAASPAWAQTLVSGAISADTRWTTGGSPYVVTANVTVQGGATLTIDAGVTVYMAPATGLSVQAGAVHAVGTAASMIRVLSDHSRQGQPSAPGDWNQWVFGSGTSASTRLERVLFEHGRGLAVNGSAPQLNHLDLRNHLGAAISIDLAASPYGVGNRASGNTVNGIAVPAGAITGSTRWGLRGIPYVVAEGAVSVGAPPALASVSPAAVEQGQTLTLAMNGTRLAGANVATLDRPGLELSAQAGGTDTQALFQLRVAADAATGPATLRLQVNAGELVLANAVTVTPPIPAITAMAPTMVDAGAGPTTITLDGRNFTSESVVTANEADLSTVFVSGTQLRAQLPVQTQGGTLQVRVRSPHPQQPLLSNTVALTVQVPVPPVLAVAPTPLALPPDGVLRSFQVTLSRADYRDHTVSVSSDHPGIAAVSPASATIAAGQTRATFQVQGLATGQTTLRFASATLGNVAVPVFVTVDFAGINTATAPVVGVQFNTEPVPPAPVAAGATSAHVGLTLGMAWVDSAPRGVVKGNGVTLTLRGVALPNNLAVAMQPPEGITLGPVSTSDDGTTATVLLSVAADAAPGPRWLVVTTASSQVLVPAAPDGDRFAVWHEPPVITSVEPIIALPGATLTPFVVRGRNLFDAAPLGFSGTGITAGASPQVNADGTELTTAIAVSATAAAGARTVTVTTPSGDSGQVVSSANTFSVVQQTGATFAGVAAPVVGVALEAPPVPVTTSLGLVSAQVGVGLGSVVHAVQPATGATGQELMVTLTGRELAGVTAATLTPATGVTVGTPVPAADGHSVQLPITIAANAPLAPRRLQLLAGTAVIPAVTGGDRFTVVAPVPELASLQPLVAPAGTTVTLTLRGIHLQNVTEVRLTPSAGITVSPPVYNAADPLGPSLAVTVSVGAAAPTGPRVVTAVAPAGESSALAGPTNTFTVTAEAGTTYPSLSSMQVGVQLAAVVVPTPPEPLALYSPGVGVQLAVESVPVAETLGVQAAQVGITVGPVVTSVSPLGLSPGQGGSLVVRGIGLPADAVVAFQPAAGIVLEGPPVVAADGSTLTQPISVAADAPLQGRVVLVSSNSVGTLPTAPLGNTWFSVGAVPEIISLSPILARQGEVLTLTIRGTQLQEWVAITAEPAAGLQFIDVPVVAADGTQLEVRVAVALDAPPGVRVIRVHTRSGATSAEPAAANSFTIYPP